MTQLCSDFSRIYELYLRISFNIHSGSSGATKCPSNFSVNVHRSQASNSALLCRPLGRESKLNRPCQRSGQAGQTRRTDSGTGPFDDASGERRIQRLPRFLKAQAKEEGDFAY